ncbi:MAG: GxxExxY protein [Bacteroidota bacterium]
MGENEIAKIIVNTTYRIHKELGPGLFESVYETVLDHEVRNEYGLIVLRQPTIPVIWRDLKMDLGFRPDMIVENIVIVELTSVETEAPVHYKQLLTYLRLTNMKLGLLINLFEELIKNGIKRVVNGL